MQQMRGADAPGDVDMGEAAGEGGGGEDADGARGED